MDIYKRLDRKLVHKGKIIDLYEDTVCLLYTSDAADD